MDDKIRAGKEKAAKFAKKGQTKKAIREYQNMLELSPGDARSLHRLGELYAREGDKSKSIDNFLRAADGYYEDGFAERALAVYKQALTVDAVRLELNMRLADAYMGKGFERDAVVHLLKAAAMYEKESMQAEELQVLERVTEIAPDDVDGHMHLAKLHVRMENTDRARDEFLHAALGLHEAGRMDEFLTVAEKTVELGETSNELYRALAESYMHNQRWEDALEALQRPLSAQSDDLDILELSARIYRGLGEPGKAASVYKRMARLARARGDSDRAEAARARLMELTGRDQVVVDRSGPPPLPAARDGDTADPEDFSQKTEPEEMLFSGADEIEDDEKTPEFLIPPDLSLDEGEDIDAGQSVDENTMMVAIRDIMTEVGSADLAEDNKTDADVTEDAELREGLIEVDFFLGQGLLDDAGEMLSRLAARYPEHPAIADRDEELRNLTFMSEEEDTAV